MVAHAFEILADPTRRRLVELLRHGEHSVGELVEKVKIHQPGVSRHLHIMQDAGFVRVRADRQRRLYSLRAEPFRTVEEWMNGYRHLLAVRLNRFGIQIEEAKAAEKRRKKRSP